MLLLGKVLGDIVGRLGFSPLIGQMTAGIILGPMILRIIVVDPANMTPLNYDLQMLTDVGILFMMFLMGLSVDLEKVMGEMVYKATLMTLCGGTLTFATTATITALLGFPINAVLLVGISFISTSTAIGFMVLSGFGDRHSKVFKTIMAVGVTDDIYAIIALSLFTSFVFATIEIKTAVILFMGVLGFIIFVLTFGRTISDKMIDFARKSRDDQPIIAFSLILLFFIAYLGQSVSIAAVSGAFLAGTILARSPLSYKVITPKIEAISEGLFIPVFFVYTGIRINAFDLLSSSPGRPGSHQHPHRRGAVPGAADGRDGEQVRDDLRLDDADRRLQAEGHPQDGPDHDAHGRVHAGHRADRADDDPPGRRRPGHRYQALFRHGTGGADHLGHRADYAAKSV